MTSIERTMASSSSILAVMSILRLAIYAFKFHTSTGHNNIAHILKSKTVNVSGSRFICKNKGVDPQSLRRALCEV
ncbi:hypothetical protein DSM3645_02873 [Blastopirellula marina DSM 3645]|uniref:Uncharacterized protein n=1 Tax=Blastopirellula marina DSM 3645 TaxID=314230 RepID=A3ZVN8_9BACT|nr:hypothetical protein DSM3645_02873 [Blastopirellula marina DSM 3645]